MNEEDEAFEELAKRQGDWGLQGSRKHQIMRYLENDAMREVQRLGQEIEQKMVMWPCLIDTADFSKGTVTVVMQCEDYKVSAGTHWLSTTPPQRTWVGLTDEDYRKLHLEMGPTYFYQDYGRAIEAKLKEKNK